MAFSKLFLNFCIFFGVIAENMFVFSVYYWLSFCFIAVITSLSFLKKILLKSTEKENRGIAGCNSGMLLSYKYLDCMSPSSLHVTISLFLSVSIHSVQLSLPCFQNLWRTTLPESCNPKQDSLNFLSANPEEIQRYPC